MFNDYVNLVKVHPLLRETIETNCDVNGNLE